MATVLYLNNTQVYPDSSQSIKLIRENPYFTESESYTLEVNLPMSILENRRFFGNIHRIEKAKQIDPMNCRMLVDNRPVLDGKARVTQITDDSIKLQLLGGRSEVNFLSSDNQDYIDELDLGYVIATRVNTRSGTIDPSGGGRAEYTYSLSTGMRIKSTPVYDETNLRYQATRQLCLVDLMVFCIEHYGYTVTANAVDVSPWNDIYIATAIATRIIRHTLPHWTVSQFLQEACKFFNVTIYTDQIHKTARIVSNVGLPSRTIVNLEPVDEYSVEVAEEDNGCIANDTLEYQLSDSEHHEYDCMDDELRNTISHLDYESKSAALQAWRGMTSASRVLSVFRTLSDGDYASWTREFNWKDDNPPVEEFIKIDMFAPLSRGGNTSGLKIVPVAIGYIYDESERDATTYKDWLVMPSMANSFPTEGYGQRMGGRRDSSSGSSDDDSLSVQSYIEGAEAPDKSEKEDRMQVMFVDSAIQTYAAHYSSLRGWSETQGIVGFTDPVLKPQFAGAGHQSWSLALRPTLATSFLGQLHVNGYSFITKAKIAIKFMAEFMPDPTDVFIIRNKRYGCEKIEANITADGFDRLMTGYFYEMTS